MDGHKIFVSYKYADDQVRNLSIFENSTSRSYVDELEKKLEKTQHIYKGESEGEDLSNLSEEQIWGKIRERIFDSTLTIVFISKGMRDPYVLDKHQWIHWEISYSLRTQQRKREDKSTFTSYPNAMLGVVLPDSEGSYSYYYEDKNCCARTCRVNHEENLFEILRKNMFNIRTPDKFTCTANSVIWQGIDHSYIETVKWDDFFQNINFYINRAYLRQDRIDQYEIRVNL